LGESFFDHSAIGGHFLTQCHINARISYIHISNIVKII
jgi:hypothetical protein